MPETPERPEYNYPPNMISVDYGTGPVEYIWREVYDARLQKSKEDQDEIKRLKDEIAAIHDKMTKYGVYL